MADYMADLDRLEARLDAIYAEHRETDLSELSLAETCAFHAFEQLSDGVAEAIELVRVCARTRDEASRAAAEKKIAGIRERLAEAMSK